MFRKFHGNMKTDGLRFVVLGSNHIYICKISNYQKPRPTAWESLKILLVVLVICLLLVNLGLCLSEVRASSFFLGSLIPYIL